MPFMNTPFEVHEHPVGEDGTKNIVIFVRDVDTFDRMRDRAHTTGDLLVPEWVGDTLDNIKNTGDRIVVLNREKDAGFISSRLG